MQDKSDGHSRGIVKIGGAIFGLNKLGRRVALSAELHAELARDSASPDVSDRCGATVGEKLRLPAIFCTLTAIFTVFHTRNASETSRGDDPRSGPARSRVDRRDVGQARRTKRAALARQLALQVAKASCSNSAAHRIAAGRNGQHKKFKFVKTLSAIAGEPRGTGKDSVEIYLLDADRKPNTPEHMQNFPIRVGTVSLIGKPKVKRGDILEVRYLYAFPSRKLCQARFERIRTDVSNIECTTAQLQFRAEDK